MGSTLTIRPAGPRDRDLLTGLLRGLSPDSAYLRFQTAIGPGPSRRSWTRSSPRACAVGLCWLRRARADRPRRMGAGGPPIRRGDRPRRGGRPPGTGDRDPARAALIADLAALGAEQVEVFASATNEAVIRMVARQAADATRERDGATVTYTFPARRAPREVRTVA